MLTGVLLLRNGNRPHVGQLLAVAPHVLWPNGITCPENLEGPAWGSEGALRRSSEAQGTGGWSASRPPVMALAARLDQTGARPADRKRWDRMGFCLRARAVFGFAGHRPATCS